MGYGGGEQHLLARLGLTPIGLGPMLARWVGRAVMRVGSGSDACSNKMEQLWCHMNYLEESHKTICGPFF